MSVLRPPTCLAVRLGLPGLPSLLGLLGPLGGAAAEASPAAPHPLLHSPHRRPLSHPLLHPHPDRANASARFLSVLREARPAAAPKPPEHWLVVHVAKTGGTSLRRAVHALAREANLSMQVAYGADGNREVWRSERLPPVNTKHPARVIMGHTLVANSPFHMLLKSSTHRYIAMLREPYAWAQSLYFHFHPVTSIADPNRSAHMQAYLQQQMNECPCILLDEPRVARNKPQYKK